LLFCASWHNRESVDAKIAYQRKEERPIPASAVRRLYDGAGWWPDWSVDGIERAIAESVAVGAWDGERLAGFARAISDGEHRAYVEDVVIDPEYRGRRIGEQIVAALVEAIGDVHIVSLFCEPERVEFYGRNGFRASETAVMVHREQDGA